MELDLQKLKPAKPPILITRARLTKWPLPVPSEGGDKNMRGTTLVIAGRDGMPGAAILCGTASLRVGAGKLQVAAVKCIAPWVAMAVPEAMVIELKEKRKGVVHASAATSLTEYAEAAQSIILGPGMKEFLQIGFFFKKILPLIKKQPLVIDAEALKCFRLASSRFLPLKKKFHGQLIITPHHGEMADILGISKTKVENNPFQLASAFARETGIVTVLKGRKTYICDPGGRSWVNQIGNVGLGTAGSGDVLSGLIGGLCSRGATPLQSAVWGVYLHAAAGDTLQKEMGSMGFLAREILDKIPRIMNEF